MGKLNIAELLKDCPQGMELDCTLFDDVYFDSIDEVCDAIKCYIKDSHHKIGISFDKYGHYSNIYNAKCVIFPKGKTTWEGFQRPFKDGDIVTWEDRGSLVAFIYKERKDVAVVKHHFALYKGSLGTVTDGEISLVENEIVFATEEEKQKLFDAIKDNGYKWNDETKTLEKLPKFKVGNSIKKSKDYISGIITNISDDGQYKVEYQDGGVSYVSLKYQDEWELVTDKFDINTLKPFDKVLVRDGNDKNWVVNIFGYYRHETKYPFYCSGNINVGFKQCIPYEKNEHLLGTTNDCDEFYKTW